MAQKCFTCNDTVFECKKALFAKDCWGYFLYFLVCCQTATGNLSMRERSGGLLWLWPAVAWGLASGEEPTGAVKDLWRPIGTLTDSRLSRGLSLHYRNIYLENICFNTGCQISHYSHSQYWKRSLVLFIRFYYKLSLHCHWWKSLLHLINELSH